MTYKMRFVLRFIILGSVLINSTPLFSQFANFTLKSTVCKFEDELLSNTSLGAVSYQWDFCFGDLDSIAVTTSTPEVLPGDFPIDLQVEYDKGNWFGFTVDFLSSNKMYRLDYGNSLTNVPNKVDLGNFGALSFPSQSRFYQEGNIWYGFVTNYVGNGLVRLTFGNGLEMSPTLVENWGSFPTLAGPIALEILDSGGDFTIIISNSLSNKLSLIHFGNSLTNNPTAGDVIETGASVGFSGIGRISVKKDGANWYGLVNSVNDSKVYRMQLGSTVYDTNTSFDLIGSISFPEGVELIEEGGKYYGLVASRNLGIYKIEFSSNFSGASVIKSLGKFGVTDEFRSLELVRDSPGWKLFTLSRNGAVLSRIDLTDRGSGTSLQASNLFEPVGVHYATAGVYTIELTAFASNGNRSTLSKPVTVVDSQAPDLDLSTANKCVTNINVFSVINSSGDLTTYSWDFNNDGIEDSNTASPTYQFSSPGDYPISLTASNSFGCTRTYEESIKINPEPPPVSFSVSSPLCTNTTTLFTNQTNELGYDNLLTYEWYLDGNLKSTDKNFTTSFDTTNDYVIRLVGLLTGCLSEVTQTVSIAQVGPTVGFSQSGKCETDQITFVNNSSGSIASYLWDFGNGNTSTQLNPTQIYAKGVYTVSLSTIGTNGCISSTFNELTIYSKPQPNFSIDLPPFSCAGTPSQFNDLTPGPSDSNINSWMWNFGDPSNGTAAITNPTYTYSVAGAYDVSLTATSNFGCTASIVKAVQIAQPPLAGFTTSAACLNQPTSFIDDSQGTNKSWLWKIGNSSYTVQNPAHVFSNIGNYSAQLTVTGNNDCVSILSKPISVPVPPVLDFSVQNNCSGQGTLFEDVSSPGADLTVSRVWDFAGQGSGNGASSQFTFTTPGTYNVKLTVTNQSGCSYALAKNTAIAISPVADFTTSLESGPAPLNVQFTNTSRNATIFTWQFNDAGNSSSSQNSPSFTYTSLGDFIVDLTATNAQGCADTKSKLVHVIIPRTEIELEEFKLLTDALTGSVRPVLIIRNNSNYTINSIDAVLDIAGNALVKEKINTSFLPGSSTSRILNYELLPGSAPLNYLCVELSVAGDSDLTDNSACISLKANEIFFAPYPNPAQGDVHVDWIASAPGTSILSVINQVGQVAYQKEISDLKIGLNQIVLDLSELNSGLYLLIFEGADSRKTFPIVIQN